MNGWRNGERADTEADPKRCTGCGETKPLSEYYEKRDNRRGTKFHVARCKACERERLLRLQKKKRAQAETTYQADLVRWGRREATRRRVRRRVRKSRAVRKAREEARRRRSTRPRPCSACGERFVPTSVDHKYCSQECRGRDYQAMRREEHTSREAARRAVQRAVARGDLWKPTVCQGCWEGTPQHLLHGHHHNGYDLAHWVDVRWLCASCHADVDEEYGVPESRLEEVLRALGAGGVVPQPVLARDIGVSLNTIRTDIGRLRERGHSIESISGAGGGVRLVPADLVSEEAA